LIPPTSGAAYVFVGSQEITAAANEKTAAEIAAVENADANMGVGGGAVCLCRAFDGSDIKVGGVTGVVGGGNFVFIYVAALSSAVVLRPVLLVTAAASLAGAGVGADAGEVTVGLKSSSSRRNRAGIWIFQLANPGIIDTVKSEVHSESTHLQPCTSYSAMTRASCWV
jgi:hypothetical protein